VDRGKRGERRERLADAEVVDDVDVEDAIGAGGG
jgi:hypothetical protein